MQTIRAALVVAILLIAASFNSVAANVINDKVTICHAAGRADTTQFVTITVAFNAVFGPGGHFNEDGTPQAGHEQDYMGPCAPEASPSTSPAPTSTSTSTAEPSATPTSTPTSAPSASSSKSPGSSASPSAPTSTPTATSPAPLPTLPETAAGQDVPASAESGIGAIMAVIIGTLVLMVIWPQRWGNRPGTGAADEEPNGPDPLHPQFR